MKTIAIKITIPIKFKHPLSSPNSGKPKSNIYSNNLISFSSPVS